MKFTITAEFPVNPKEDRNMVIESLVIDIGKAGFNVEDVLEPDTKRDPVFVISGDVPARVNWKNRTGERRGRPMDQLSILPKAVIDSAWLREFKILEIAV